MCGLGCGLLYLITTDYPYWRVGIYVGVIGVGIGLLLQTLLIITQFSVQKFDMAVATATNSFVRTIGGVIGVAVLGAVLNSVLKQQVDPSLLTAALAGYSVIVTLPAAEQASVFNGYVDALQLVFVIGVPVSVLAILFSFGITRKKIAKKAPKAVSPEDPGQNQVDADEESRDIPPMEI